MEAANNEMPLAFHFLAACVVIGQLLGLETWATLAKGVPIFPNVNALLLSPAGKCRRGEGTKITVAIAKRTGMNVLEGRTTPEALLDELAENGNTLLYVEELSMLLTKQEFQRPIIPVLTKLLLHGQGKVDMRTRQFGKKHVPFVNLSALFTSAPDWFMQTIPDEAFGGGMMSRFVVCCLDDREIFNINIQADDDQEARTLDRLGEGLEHVTRGMKGKVKGTNEAQKWVEKWYMHNEQAIMSDERLEPHRNRKPANLLRMAMILGAAGGETQITQTLLEHSLAIMDWFEPTLAKLYGITDDVLSRLGRGDRRILARLAATPGNRMEHSVLTRACAVYFKGGVREMRVCLEGMCEKGLVTAVGPGRWPPRVWLLNDVKVE
jgi:hypothetical protein